MCIPFRKTVYSLSHYIMLFISELTKGIMFIRPMILRSVILRGSVSFGGLKVTTKDISLSVLVRSLTDLKLSESIQYCSIKKLEVNWELSQQELDKSQPLDKCVAYILKEDIQVPEVTLMLNIASHVLQSPRYR